MRADSPVYRVGDTATLWGVALDDSSGIAGLTKQAAVWRKAPVNLGVSITKLVLSGQTAIDANTVEYAYRADLVNTGSARKNVIATDSKSLRSAVITATGLTFGDVAASSTATSGNSLRIQLPSTQVSSANSLTWSYPARHVGNYDRRWSFDGTAGGGLYEATTVRIGTAKDGIHFHLLRRTSSR